MDFDEAGNLIVAHWGSGHLEVFGPGGPIFHVKTLKTIGRKRSLQQLTMVIKLFCINFFFKHHNIEVFLVCPTGISTVHEIHAL
jgi:hypothetical protein